MGQLGRRGYEYQRRIFDLPQRQAAMLTTEPAAESTNFMLLLYTGAMVGTVIAMPLSGLLCSRGFGHGWSSIFYTYGNCSL